MWKVFALFCALNGECAVKYEHPPAYYDTFEKCIVRADEKKSETLRFMKENGVTFRSFQTGCEYTEMYHT